MQFSKNYLLVFVGKMCVCVCVCSSSYFTTISSPEFRRKHYAIWSDLKASEISEPS